MEKVKIAIVGMGNMGSSHIVYLSQLPEAEVVAVCDIVHEKADRYAAQYGIAAYYRHADLLDHPGLQAILIAVPHYDHEPIAIDAMNRGIHVLVEKPITVHVNGAKRMIAAYEAAKGKHPGLIFAEMFNERTQPHYKKIKDLIASGELGKLTRATWINTAWFRSQAYYNSGGWRATWKGEGGGILTNQCPHNLDMYQWLFGMPATVVGHAHIGKYHDIEVEDEVTAYFEHEDGMIGHFIVSTAECPGTNRLEIVGENGTLVYERGNLTYYRNRQSMLTYSRTTSSSFGTVENWETHIPIDRTQPSNHRVVTEGFLRTILTGEDHLVAWGEEGLAQVMLANGIMLSSFEDRRVSFPLDGDPYERKLQELIANSKFEKVVDASVTTDFERSKN